MITKDPTTGTETVTYLHTDYDDTPRMATNQSGTILWRWEGVFGDTLPSPNGVDVTLRYPGQTYDSETGLFYNWNRYYDPGTGRYVSSDPMGCLVERTRTGTRTIVRFGIWIPMGCSVYLCPKKLHHG